MEKLKEFKEHLKEIAKLDFARWVLYWDQRIYMPPKAQEARAEVYGKLSRMHHEMLVSLKTGEFVEHFNRSEVLKSLNERDRALIHVVTKLYRRRVAIPADLYERFQTTCSKAESGWEKAREKSNFDLFRPYLEEIVDLVRQFADLYGYEENPYDAWLEEFEPGMTTKELKEIIKPLQKNLVPYLKRLKEGSRPNDDFLKGEFSVEKQKELSLRALRAIGYDFDAGRLNTTVHPFQITMGPSDVRVTTRFDPNDLRSSLFLTLHEGGHALYDQGFDSSLYWTPLADGASEGIHESQSRLWENLIGRSLSFWKFFYSQLVEVFPAFKAVPIEDFYRAVNIVEPSLIRVEADEVTYNLHIMLRFELEEALLNGRIEAKQLPELWRDAMDRYLGVIPQNDAQGVLQDVHWSSGYFGYFPSYMLGNLYAAQIFATAKKEIVGLQDKIAAGDLATLREWLREKIHKHGKTYEPKELMERVTGEKLKSDYFIDYITEKYNSIYRI